MILGKALKQGCSLFQKVGIIAALRASNGCVQSASISQPVNSTEFADHLGVDFNNLIHGEVASHWLSRRSRSGCSCTKESSAARKLMQVPGDCPALRYLMNSSTTACSSPDSVEIKSIKFRDSTLDLLGSWSSLNARQRTFVCQTGT